MLSGCFSPGADIVGSSSSGATGTTGMTGTTVMTGMTGMTGTTGTTGAATEAVTDTTTAPTSSETMTTGTTTAGDTTTGSPSTGDTTMGDATSTADDSTGMTTEVGTTEPQVPCGNKALDPGEECDDGDIVDGDGCSKECKFEHRYVFITSGSYVANGFGQLAFYDGKCQTLADSQPKLTNRTFVAWMSITNEAARDRIGSSSVPYLLTDGVTKVANDTQDLLDGGLAAAIQRDEKNNPVVGSSLVWTGTSEDGTAALENCLDWTAVLSKTGVVGDATKNNAAWTNSPVGAVMMGCSNSRRIYCIEKPM